MKLVYSDASHKEDGGLMSQHSPPWEDGGRGCYNEEERNRTKRSRKGLKVFYVQMSTVHFDKASDGLVCIILV